MTKPGAAAWVEWVEPMIETFLNMGKSIGEFFPVLMQGLVLLVVLLIVAKVLSFVLRTVCRNLKLDIASEKFGVHAMLAKFGVQSPLSSVIGKVVFWMMALYAVKAAADLWGISDISNFVQSLILFLPKLFVAVCILFAGLLAADLVRKAVFNGLDNIGVDYAGLIANFIYGLLAVMILTVVLGQLGIQTELLSASVKILLAAFGFSVALSLGLGLRPVARNVVSGVYARDMFPPGSILKVEEGYATVREVGAVATRLESENGSFVVIPNSLLVSQVTRGRKKSREFAEKL